MCWAVLLSGPGGVSLQLSEWLQNAVQPPGSRANLFRALTLAPFRQVAAKAAEEDQKARHKTIRTQFAHNNAHTKRTQNARWCGTRRPSIGNGRHP